MSYASHTFPKVFSSIFGVSIVKAAELHETITGDIFDRGYAIQTASDQSFDKIQNGWVRTLGHAAVYAKNLEDEECGWTAPGFPECQWIPISEFVGHVACGVCGRRE